MSPVLIAVVCCSHLYVYLYYVSPVLIAVVSCGHLYVCTCITCHLHWLQPVQFTCSLVRSSAPTLHDVNREYRRVSHITAEQRRRCSIKVRRPVRNDVCGANLFLVLLVHWCSCVMSKHLVTSWLAFFVTILFSICLSPAKLWYYYYYYYYYYHHHHYI